MSRFSVGDTIVVNMNGTNEKIRLETDLLSTDRDRYNQLLRYVHLADGTLINQELIQHS